MRTYGDTNVCDNAVADLEVLHVLSLLHDTTNSFMAWNELWIGVDVSELAAIHCARCIERVQMAMGVRTGNLAMNSPSWMWASVPQTPHRVTICERNERS